LFIATQVFDSLSPSEIRAALAHEKAHLVVRDNLKRGLVRACRDVLAIVPCGRSLDRVWAEDSEAAADELAARAGAPVALDLASALVKIARIVPAGSKPAMPAGAFLVGDAVGGVASRVRRLTQLASADCVHEGRGAAALSLAIWTCLGAFFIALTLAATNTHILATTHAFIEHAVHSLR
jgi:Zn-dependent protease with chaperone function